jgi:hypothetical protein
MMTATTKTAVRGWLLGAACIVLGAGCSNQSSGSGDEILLPQISEFPWKNQTDAGDVFHFNPDQEGVRVSAFSGNEQTNDQLFSFTGSFSDRSINFTYDTSNDTKAGLTYTGTIDGDSAQMTLDSSAGSLVLIKQPPSS